METTVPRPAAAWQADCRHSREPFDASFRVIARRRDISPSAKLVHAYLVTLLRTGRGENQTEIGAALGLSRHQVWRATDELVAAGLVVVTRRGQGRPNGYELLGVPADDLGGRATGRPAGRQPDVRPAGIPTRARDSGPKKKDERIPGPLSVGQCMGCKGPHATPSCPRWGYVFRT